MLDYIQNEFLILFTTLADPELGAGAETSTFRLWPKVPAPCGSGSTTLGIGIGTGTGTGVSIGLGILYV